MCHPWYLRGKQESRCFIKIHILVVHQIVHNPRDPSLAFVFSLVISSIADVSWRKILIELGPKFIKRFCPLERISIASFISFFFPERDLFNFDKTPSGFDHGNSCLKLKENSSFHFEPLFFSLFFSGENMWEIIAFCCLYSKLFCSIELWFKTSTLHNNKQVRTEPSMVTEH